MVATITKRYLKPIPDGASEDMKIFYSEVAEILNYIQEQIILTNKTINFENSVTKKEITASIFNYKVVSESVALVNGIQNVTLNHGFGAVPNIIINELSQDVNLVYGYLVSKTSTQFTVSVASTGAATRTLGFMVA